MAGPVKKVPVKYSWVFTSKLLVGNLVTILEDKIKVIPSGIDLSPIEKIIQNFKEDKISLRQKIGLAPESGRFAAFKKIPANPGSAPYSGRYDF